MVVIDSRRASWDLLSWIRICSVAYLNQWWLRPYAVKSMLFLVLMLLMASCHNLSNCSFHSFCARMHASTIVVLLPSASLALNRKDLSFRCVYIDSHPRSNVHVSLDVLYGVYNSFLAAVAFGNRNG